MQLRLKISDLLPVVLLFRKNISKILTNRFQVVIGEVVNDAQSGFILDRHVVDNILLATDLIRGYSRTHMSPRCIMKVDIRKAYDSLQWSFVEILLHELVFPSCFVGWLMECVRSVSYEILVNGVPSLPFRAKKRVQGEPLFPFLLAMNMEYLSRCLNELKNVPHFNYHPKCKRVNITHLMFADDLLLFSRANASSISLLFNAFQKFFEA